MDSTLVAPAQGPDKGAQVGLPCAPTQGASAQNPVLSELLRDMPEVLASLHGELTVEQDPKEHTDSLHAECATQGVIWPPPGFKHFLIQNQFSLATVLPLLFILHPENLSTLAPGPSGHMSVRPLEVG